MRCSSIGLRAVVTVALGFVCSASSMFSSSALAADSWPTFRGADRTGVSDDKGLLQQWPEGGPPLVWQVQGTGRGYSSPAIAGGRIVTLGDGLTPEDAEEYLFCLDEKTGAQLWKTKTGAPWNEGQATWQGSRSTPTIDGELVYVTTPTGVLICCDVATGAERWRKDFKADFEGAKADPWGYSESPLVDGDVVVCTPGGEKATMVALDKKSGEVRWKAARPGDIGAGHSSIVITQIGGTKVYVQMTSSGAMGVRASDGELLWTYPVEKTTSVIPTPIVRDDLVYLPVGYRRGAALVRQVPAEGGKVTVEEIYPFKPDLANKHGGAVLMGDQVYFDSDDQGIPRCADLMTGEVRWKKRGSGKGSASIVGADGCIYVRFADGTVALAKATPEDYVEISSFKVPGSGERPSWAHPVIVGGKLYLREHNRLLCYDLVAKDGAAQASAGFEAQRR